MPPRPAKSSKTRSSLRPVGGATCSNVELGTVDFAFFGREGEESGSDRARITKGSALRDEMERAMLGDVDSKALQGPEKEPKPQEGHFVGNTLINGVEGVVQQAVAVGLDRPQ